MSGRGASSTPLALALLIAVAGLAVPRTARAQVPEPEMNAEARARFDRGAALVAERRYDEAAREFQGAYQLDPRKQSLFAWAQVERLRGQCRRAIELYRQFLASGGLTASQQEAAQLNIRRCEREGNGKAGPPGEARPPEGAAPVAARPDVAAAAPPSAPVRSRGAVILAASLLGGAVAAAGTAGTFYYLSLRDEGDAQEAEVFDAYEAAMSRARSRQRVAAALLGGGVVLGVGALLQWVTSARAPEATAWVDGRGGGGVLVGGRY